MLDVAYIPDSRAYIPIVLSFAFDFSLQEQLLITNTVRKHCWEETKFWYPEGSPHQSHLIPSPTWWSPSIGKLWVWWFVRYFSYRSWSLCTTRDNLIRWIWFLTLLSAFGWRGCYFTRRRIKTLRLAHCQQTFWLQFGCWAVLYWSDTITVLLYSIE